MHSLWTKSKCVLQQYWPLLLLAFVAFLPWTINLFDPFVSDDWDFLYHAAQQDFSIIHYYSTNNLGEAGPGAYRPLVAIVWFVQYHLFGVNSFPYHLVTTGFHVANALLLFFFISRLRFLGGEKTRKTIGYIAALIFALFPNHSEAVAWLAVINDTMLTTFYLSSLILCTYCLDTTRSAKFRWGSGVVSVIFFFLALSTKEMAITLPGVVGLIILFEGAKTLQTEQTKQTVQTEQKEQTSKLPNFQTSTLFTLGKSAILLIPYLVTLGIYFLLRYRAVGAVTADYTGAEFYIDTYLALRSYLSITLSYSLTDEFFATVTKYIFDGFWKIAPFVFIATVVGIFFAYRAKVKSAPLFFLLAYIGSIVPVMRFGVNFLPTYFMSEGERLAYVPGLFFAGLLAYVGFRIYQMVGERSKKILLTLFVCALVSNAGLLIQKNLRWHTASRLAERLVEQVSESYTKGEYDGYVLVGVPDMYHGAFIFRNAISYAVAFEVAEKKGLEVRKVGSLEVAKNVLPMSMRTVISDNPKFSVEAVSSTGFIYRADSENSFVVAAPKLVTADYQFALGPYSKELWSISYAEFGKEITIDFSDAFVRDNMHKKIGLFFFTGSDWQTIVFEPK